MTSKYQDYIREDLVRFGQPGMDPRWIEAWMRIEHSTLDAMSTHQFDHEVRVAIACVQAAGRDQSEQCARSFGL